MTHLNVYVGMYVCIRVWVFDLWG